VETAWKQQSEVESSTSRARWSESGSLRHGAAPGSRRQQPGQISHARGRWFETSRGVEMESPKFFQLLEFRSDQLIRGRMFGTKREALEAAGLNE
jgi:hypothetical protein